MKKQMLHFIIMLCAMIVLCCSTSMTAHAYTEEEKQQAKAWLSAHGYSPDASGASQAYQDYLNGKFDEELGITTTEQAATQSTETNTETQTDKDDTKEQNTETDKATTERAAGTSNNSNGIGQGDGTSADGETADVTSEDSNDGSESVEQTITAGSKEQDDVEPKEPELYQEENLDTYKEAATVIVLSVMLVLVIMGLWQFRKSDKQ